MSSLPKLEENPTASPVHGSGEPATEAASPTTATTPKKTKGGRLRKKSEIASPSVETPAKRASARPSKGKAKAVAPPEAKAPEEKREKKKKETATEKEAAKAAASKKRKGGAAPGKILPPPLGWNSVVTTVSEGLPGWNNDGEILWKAYGDLSRMPKTDSIVAVSLNNGPIQVGDHWRREQGYAPQDSEDWMWWSAACVPALTAIATGSAGASAFSPDGGAGLAGALPKEPFNLIATAHGGPDKAVAAAEAAAEAALSKVPPAPARPLFLLRSDGTIKGAVNGKAAQKLERTFDAAAARILTCKENEDGGSSSPSPPPPFVVCIIRSKNKEGMLEEIAEHVAPKLGLPAPDADKSTFVAAAVGKNWFEGGGGGGGGGRGRGGGSYAAAPPSDVDTQFALDTGFSNVLEMPQAFGPSELKHSVSGRQGFLSGALEHVSAADRAAAAAAAAAGEEAPAPTVAVPTDGRALVAACDKVLSELEPGCGDPVLENNRGLVALFQALSYYWGEVAGDKFRGRTFATVADTLAKMDEELGVLDSPEKFRALCAGPKKLEGFGEGTFRRAKEWFEGGLPEELAAYKK